LRYSELKSWAIVFGHFVVSAGPDFHHGGWCGGSDESSLWSPGRAGARPYRVQIGKHPVLECWAQV
ncbi:MAG TPA: hypothetical protein VE641_13220, partial [Chthoniobacterales bacterium]|nr:hypothetical protein [Chthoniobacterales bacterium]